MVPIRQREIQLKNEDGLATMFFYAFNKIDMGKFNERNFNGDDFVAFKGYCGEKVNQSDIDKIIKKPATKGFDYSNNIYRFIGVHLASETKDLKELDDKFLRFSIKNKFAVSLQFPCFQQQLKEIVKNSSDAFGKLLNIFFHKDVESISDEDNILFTDLENNSQADIIDVILYKAIIQKLKSIKVNALSAVETTKHILGNFQDAIKSITTIRRQGKAEFNILDEYDVQDIVYLMLKGVFHDLQVENPFMKKAGKSSKIDLITVKEQIAIETKMMLDGYTDKKIIEQLKIDIQDYSTWKAMRHLVIFVYDPKNRISDKSKFYELNGITEISEVRFNVHVIISN